MPAEKRYNSVLFGGMVPSWAGGPLPLHSLVLTFSLRGVVHPVSPWSGHFPLRPPGVRGNRELHLFQV